MRILALGTAWWSALHTHTYTHTHTHTHKYSVIESASCGMEALAERSPIKNLIRASEIRGSRRWALEASSTETKGGARSWMSAREPTTLLNPEEKVVQCHWQDISKVALPKLEWSIQLQNGPVVSVRVDYLVVILFLRPVDVSMKQQRFGSVLVGLSLSLLSRICLNIVQLWKLTASCKS